MKPSIIRLIALGIAAFVGGYGLWALLRDAPDSLDQAVAEMLADGIDGAVVAFGPLGQNPEVRLYGAAGEGALAPLSGDSRFRFASLTKPVVSAAINELAVRGEISLDNTVPELLPSILFSDPQMQEVTVRDLLRHTSGIDEGAEVEPLFLSSEDLQSEMGLDASAQRGCRGIAEAFAARPLTHSPGTRTLYSNTGYCYLGLIIEEQTGQPLEGALWDLVPEAAAFSFDTDKISVIHDVPEETQGFLVMQPHVAGAAGGLIGSPVDYHRFLARPLEPGVMDRPPFEVDLNSHWGLGWRVWPERDCPKRTHFGSMPGTYSVAMVDAEDNGFVAFFNGRPAEDWPPFEALTLAACDVFRRR